MMEAAHKDEILILELCKLPAVVVIALLSNFAVDVDEIKSVALSN